MFTEPWLKQFEARLNTDKEMSVIGDWFTLSMSLSCGDERRVLRFERGRLVQSVLTPKLDAPCAFGFRASLEIGRRFFSDSAGAALSRRLRDADARAGVRPRRRHAGGDAARPRAASRDEGHANRDALMTIEPIVGRYLNVNVADVAYRIYFEEAGQGTPLLCLHTAGADSRQYRHLMTDEAITRNFRVIAFDMPYHGRSNPPDGWWLEKYRLTTGRYTAIIRAVWTTLDLDRPVVVGCSMGGAIVLKLAADYQRELGGIIGLESSAFAPGRYHDFLHHPAIHGGELAATYTYALCAPQSPESSTRENWWYLQPGRARRVRG